MAGFSEDGVCWRERLQAYGVSPGSELEVVQQSPVTVVRIDHVELAFEHSVARDILISPPEQNA
jgi:Fe2+ transport system protein FeoA